MTDREKLARLIDEVAHGDIIKRGGEWVDVINTEDIADHLIAHGVTVRETTSEDFLAKVKDLRWIHYPDFGTMHSVLDLAMEELLVELGYEAAVDFIRDQERRYS